MNQEFSQTTDKRRRKAVAMAYVPWQEFDQAFEPQRALSVGTIFPELYKPFTGKNGGCRR